MVDNICSYLTNKMKQRMPDMDEEKTLILDYGLHIIVGEIPKVFIMIAIAFLLGVGELTILAFLLMLPYRNASGGFHLKSHLGCIVGTTTFYSGTALLSKYITLPPLAKYVLVGIVWIFGICMIKKYAPADTENIPIISKQERKKKKIASYVILSITLMIALFIPYSVLANLLIFGSLIQTLSITRVVYKLTNNKYGHEEYEKGNLILD